MAHEKFGAAAEEALLEAGAITVRTKNRREILGCLGCQFLTAQAAGKEPAAYGYEINDCMNREKTWPTYVSLHKLEEGGALISQQVTKGSAGPARRVYRPADTELGRVLLANLEMPDTCPIETWLVLLDKQAS